MRLALLLTFGMLSFVLLRQSGAAGVDWAPLWTAGRLSLTNPELVYDSSLITRLQPEPFAGLTDRPFIYPPSALLLFAPVSVIPFTASYAIFATASLVSIAWASAKAEADTLLVIISPPVVLASIAGQPTLMVAGLVLVAFLHLDRPTVAGLLLGIAAMLKPTLLILAPVALVAGRHWRTTLHASLTMAMIGLASAATFGWELWSLWLESIPKFQRLFSESPLLLRSAVSPFALGVRLGVSSAWIIAAMAAIAIPVVCFTFWNKRPAVVQAAVLIGGSLLVAPYAMFYELAALAPFAAAHRKPIDFFVAAIWGMSLFVTASIAGLVAVFARAAVQPGRPRGEPRRALPDGAASQI